MRRPRDIRNYRDSQIHRPRVLGKKHPKIEKQVEVSQKKIDKPISEPTIPPTIPTTIPSTPKKEISVDKTVIAKEKLKQTRIKKIIKQRKAQKKQKYKSIPSQSSKPIGIEFIDFDKYKYTGRTLNVCHLIDSLGMGGAQVMTMELINGLNKYYGSGVNNMFVCLVKKNKKYDSNLYSSYGIFPIQVVKEDFSNFLVSNSIDIVVHHRTAHSKCIKYLLTDRIKYILVNHTWNNLYSMKYFLQCDYYISVCNFLHARTHWHPAIHASRKTYILNGIENDFISDIEPYPVEGTFKTGRCHRLTADKFHLDSLVWLNNKVGNSIDGFTHYLMGHNGQADRISKTLKKIHYIGAVNNKIKKFSIIKELDVYFYETFQEEGASIAVLEALACGVPVICKAKGGNVELVRDGVNGFIVADRSGYMKKMMFLADPVNLQRFKDRSISDFNHRLHVKYAACKYIQLFEQLVGK